MSILISHLMWFFSIIRLINNPAIVKNKAKGRSIKVKRGIETSIRIKTKTRARHS
jgi:hypothetical protein